MPVLPALAWAMVAVLSTVVAHVTATKTVKHEFRAAGKFLARRAGRAQREANTRLASTVVGIVQQHKKVAKEEIKAEIKNEIARELTTQATPFVSMLESVAQRNEAVLQRSEELTKQVEQDRGKFQKLERIVRKLAKGKVKIEEEENGEDGEGARKPRRHSA